jgi:hypothetical protein
MAGGPDRNRASDLTDREREVLDAVCRPLREDPAAAPATNQDIAAEVFLRLQLLRRRAVLSPALAAAALALLGVLALAVGPGGEGGSTGSEAGSEEAIVAPPDGKGPAARGGASAAGAERGASVVFDDSGGLLPIELTADETVLPPVTTVVEDGGGWRKVWWHPHKRVWFDRRGRRHEQTWTHRREQLVRHRYIHWHVRVKRQVRRVRTVVRRIRIVRVRRCA